MFDIRYHDRWATNETNNVGKPWCIVTKSVEGDFILCTQDYKDVPGESMRRIHKEDFRDFKLLSRIGGEILYADYDIQEPLTEKIISLLKAFLPGYEIQITKTQHGKTQHGVMSDNDFVKELARVNRECIK